MSNVINVGQKLVDRSEVQWETLSTVSDHETDHPTANREMQVRFCTSSLPM